MLLTLAFALATVASSLQVYTGTEPADARSLYFAVTLQQPSSQPISPMVYMSASPNEDLDQIHRDGFGRPIFCSLHGSQFCNRSVSWVEFGTSPSEPAVTLTVTSLNGPVFGPAVTVHPLALGLQAVVSNSGHTVRLQLPAGRLLQLTLEFGAAPNGSFRDALMVFVGEKDPEIPDRAAGVMRFEEGTTTVAGDGILQLPDGVTTVFLPRGAWLDGRINITRHQLGAVSVVGHGVISGRRFAYHGGKVQDSLRCVEIQYDRPLFLKGPTIVDPKGHSLFVPPNSQVRNLKIVGWLFNEDGVWLTSNSSLTSSFIRTNDDAIRFYAGELDVFRNIPGPKRGIPAANIQVRDVVISQLFNGAILQIGWEDAGVQDSVVSGVDVVRAEWYKTSALAANNALLSLRGPVYDVTMEEHHRNLTVEQVRVDGTIGRLIGMGLFGTAQSTVQGVTLRNVTVRHSLQWWPTSTGTEEPGDNFLIAEEPDTIGGVRFEAIFIGGQKVERDGDWNLNVSGRVSNVTYDGELQSFT
jgi:hypothetical protein